MALPQVLEWNIIKFMSHPCADIIKQAVAEANKYDDHFFPLNVHTFSEAYLMHFFMNNSCDCCAKVWRECICMCPCGLEYRVCKNQCYDHDDPRNWSEADLEERYDDMINECYPEVEIGVFKSKASAVLEAMDPILYRSGMQEYLNSCIEDHDYDRLNHGFKELN